MDNQKKVIKIYSGLQPYEIGFEEMGRIDPRIYAIRKGGATGTTYFAFPYQYLWKIYKERAEKLQQAFDNLDHEGKYKTLMEMYVKVKKERDTERRKNDILSEQISKLRKNEKGEEVYLKILESQEVNEKLQEYLNKSQVAQSEKDKAVKENLFLKKRSEAAVKYTAELNKEEDRLKEVIDSLNFEVETLKKGLDAARNANPNEALCAQIIELKTEINQLEAKVDKYRKKYGEI